MTQGTFCTNCGTALQANARFCIGCGTPVEDEAAEQGRPQQQGHPAPPRPGHQQGYQPPPPQGVQPGYAPQPPAQQRSRRGLVMGAALAALALIALAVVRPGLIPGTAGARSAVGGVIPGGGATPKSGVGVVDAIFANPVPAQLQGWKPSPFGGASLRDKSELEPGEIGAVYVYLQAEDGSGSELSFVVAAYKSPADARAALDDQLTSSYVPEMLAGVGLMAIQPGSLDGRCMGVGSMVGACHVVTGRTLVFVSFQPSQPIEVAVTVLTTYVAHVQANGG